MRELKVVNNVGVERLQWFGEELLVSLSDTLNDVKVADDDGVRSVLFEALRDIKSVNVAYSAKVGYKPDTVVVYVEFAKEENKDD